MGRPTAAQKRKREEQQSAASNTKKAKQQADANGFEPETLALGDWRTWDDGAQLDYWAETERQYELVFMLQGHMSQAELEAMLDDIEEDEVAWYEKQMHDIEEKQGKPAPVSQAAPHTELTVPKAQDEEGEEEAYEPELGEQAAAAAITSTSADAGSITLQNIKASCYWAGYYTAMLEQETAAEAAAAAAQGSTSKKDNGSDTVVAANGVEGAADG